MTPGVLESVTAEEESSSQLSSGKGLVFLAGGPERKEGGGQEGCDRELLFTGQVKIKEK